MVARRSVGNVAKPSVHSAVPEVDELARQTRELQRDAPPWGNGVLISLDFGTAEAKTVLHLLGRVPRGWFLVDELAGLVRSIGCTGRDDKRITFVSDGICRVKVWVY